MRVMGQNKDWAVVRRFLTPPAPPIRVLPFATNQVPVEVSADRQLSLAMRWLVTFAKNRRGTMTDNLATEIKDAAMGQGSAIKKRDDTHKMAQANRAFAHFRW